MSGNVTGTPISVSTLAADIAAIVGYGGNLSTASVTPTDTNVAVALGAALAARLALTGGTISGTLGVTGATSLAALTATTGAFSGALTLSASGTALSVTNNATVGGALAINGTGTALNVAHAINVAGPATLGSATINGDVSVLGPASNFLYGNGNEYAFSGAASFAQTPVGFQSNLSGTVASGLQGYFEVWVSSDSVNVPVSESPSELAAILVQHTLTTGATGNRWACDIAIGTNAALVVGESENGYSAGPGALRATATTAYNLGGTNTSSLASTMGQVFGGNISVNAVGTATALRAVVGLEIDYQVASGASAWQKVGLKIGMPTGDANSGVGIDCAIGIDSQYVQGGGPGAIVGFNFGPSGNFPINSAGIMIGVGSLGTTISAATCKTGIDFTLVTFTGNAIQTPGFSVDGSGDITGLALSVTSGAFSGQLNANASGTGLAVANNATIGGTLGVTGATSLAGLTAAAGAFSGEITATASGTGLAVTNNATVGGTLGVTGTATLGAINASGAISSTLASGTGLAVTANATVGGTLGVTGAITLSGGGSLSGTFSGTPTFSGALSITATGTSLTTSGGISANSLSVTNGITAATFVGSSSFALTGLGSSTPSSGNTITMTAAQSCYRILGTSTLSTLTLKLPPSPANGLLVRISSQCAITAFTVEDSSGSTTDVQTAPTSLAAGSGFVAQWSAGSSTWWCSVGA